MSLFAEIALVDEIADVPIKFKILHKAPRFMLEWYIKKYNPFTAEDMEILGERGLFVRMPLTELDRKERPEYFREQVMRTLYSLREYGVGIILLPTRSMGTFIEPVKPAILPIADGSLVFAFFMMQAIEKTLKHAGKNIKTAEIVLIDGNPDLSMSILDNIYPHLNYLTLITDLDYSDKCAQIYGDCGLNVSTSDYNRSGLESADIIINTHIDNKFDYYYKRGAIYFDLARGNVVEIALKREDILIVDGLRLCRIMDRTEDMSLERLECGLFVASRDYRRLKSRYDSRFISPVEQRIKTFGYSVRGLTFCGRTLSGVDFDSVFRKL